MSDDLQLVHYSDAPVSRVETCAQYTYPHFKPRGLWVSCDNCELNWREWCEGEQFGVERLACVHDVMLTKSANVLRIRDAAGIDALTNEYRAAIDQMQSYFMMDWAKVASRYQGIIIAPYIWERRLFGGSDWYYGWDCASGCIWDAAAIKSITLRQETARNEKGIGQPNEIAP